MEPSVSRGAHSYTCSRCSGIWIGGESLHELFASEQGGPEVRERFEALFELDFTASPRSCPICATQKLKAVNVDGTELDFCVLCKGVYFDKGELEEVYSTGLSVSGKSIGEMLSSSEGAFWATLVRLFGGNR